MRAERGVICEIKNKMNKKLKIGFLITYFYPFTGGAESNCLNLAIELVKKGHEIHIFTSDRKNNKIIENLKEEYKGIKIHRYRTWFRYKYYFAFYPSIVDILRYNLDILHVHTFGIPQQDLVILLEKLKGTKLVCTPHGPFMALNESSYSKSALILKKIYMPLIKFVNKRFDRVIMVNPYQYSWMKNFGVKKEQIIFVPNGIQKSTFKKISLKKIKQVQKKYKLEGKFIISYLGRIQKYKGLDQIIKIMPNLLKVKKNIVFLVIGEDAGDLLRLQEIIKKLKIENVIFTGKIPEDEREDILALLDISEIFVFPSEWEAFGISLIEAMARENAVISTDTEGSKFLVSKENGFLYKFNNLKNLEKYIKILLTNDKLRRKMQKENLKKAQAFLWEKIAVKLEKVYEELNNNQSF